MTRQSNEMRVAALRWEADTIISVELRNVDGSDITSFEAGAHIDLHLPNGMVRSYSLSNDPGERCRYVIGVGLAADSRGGSRFIHDRLRPGQIIRVSEPRNNFPLNEDGQTHVLIAGGIGVTPILAMTRRLATIKKDFHLYYAVRGSTRAAFLDELGKLQPNLTLHVDAENDAPMNLGAIIASHPAAHFYCCGPTGMLDAFEAAAAQLPETHVHLERFAAKPIDASTDNNAFDVECRKSGLTLTVTPEQSIADAMEAAGMNVSLSCREGICGSCETRVVEGEIDHRDSILSNTERASNKTMMICVSRCAGKRLVLDI